MAQVSKVCDAGHGLVADIIDVQQEEGSLVAAGVSDRLDQLKAAYHELPGALTRVVEAELARIPRALSHNLSQQTWTCVYVPQARALRLPSGIQKQVQLSPAADMRKVFAWKWLPIYYKGKQRAQIMLCSSCVSVQSASTRVQKDSQFHGIEIPRCIGKSEKEVHCIYRC